MNIGDLALALQAPLDVTLSGLYALAHGDSSIAFMTRLTTGCTVSEVGEAEIRIDYLLPPLHRSILNYSNGGSLPYANSIEWFAAAVAREAAWHVLGPVPGDMLNENDPVYRPRPPLILGTSLDRQLAEVGIDIARFPPGPRFDSFIVMGQGFFDVDGFYCYCREDPGPIYAVCQPDHGVYAVADDFDTFIRGQTLDSMCEEPSFLAQLQVILHSGE